MDQPNPEKLLEAAKVGVHAALKAGASEAEAFIVWVASSGVHIERGQVSGSTKRLDEGLGVRTVTGKAIGFAFSNKLTAAAVTGKRAAETAKSSSPDKNWRSLPKATKKPMDVAGTFDQDTASTRPEEASEMASSMLEASQEFDARVFPFEGTVSSLVGYKVVYNSYGLKGWDRGSFLECSLGTIARGNGYSTPICFEYDAKRVGKIDPVWVGVEAAKQAISSLNPTKIESSHQNVILTQPALSALFYHTIVNALKADFVQRDRSALKGKVGETIASNTLTIHDNAVLEGGLGTWRFDDEGVASQDTCLIERGVLRGYMYDHYTAAIEGKSSTGNGRRPSGVPYSVVPHVEPSNFVVSPGALDEGQILKEVGSGLLVGGLQGAHSSDAETGEFSAVATPAWRIENGQVAGAVRPPMIAGNVYGLIRNIVAVAKNVRQFDYLVAPWVAFSNVRVVGA